MAAERLRADLILLLVAVVWGSAFVAQRVAANHMGVYLFNGLRFLTGAVILAPFALRRSMAPGRFDRKHLPGMLAAGGLLFAGASLQQWGLRFTTAGNAGFITGLYVVFVPLILALGWRQWPGWTVWAASLLATAGLFLLSTGGEFRLTPGDGLELLGALAFAFHVIWIGRLARRVEVLPLAVVQYLVVGVLSLAVSAAVETNRPGTVLEAWWTVAYTGILSIGLGYTLQAVGQQVAPATDAAILLSMESAFAALFGWLALEEKLAPVQLSGCVLMLLGIVMAQTQAVRASRRKAGT
jgi:drug/metabolite transporter (DMT)-like permease